MLADGPSRTGVSWFGLSKAFAARVVDDAPAAAELLGAALKAAVEGPAPPKSTVSLSVVPVCVCGPPAACEIPVVAAFAGVPTVNMRPRSAAAVKTIVSVTPPWVRRTSGRPVPTSSTIDVECALKYHFHSLNASPPFFTGANPMVAKCTSSSAR